jgi:hypothetical protein
MRAFRHDGMTYVPAMPGQLYRSKDDFHPFDGRKIPVTPM